jgi:hypothetical protein
MLVTAQLRVFALGIPTKTPWCTTPTGEVPAADVPLTGASASCGDSPRPAGGEVVHRHGQVGRVDATFG